MAVHIRWPSPGTHGFERWDRASSEAPFDRSRTLCPDTAAGCQYVPFRYSNRVRQDQRARRWETVSPLRFIMSSCVHHTSSGVVLVFGLDVLGHLLLPDGRSSYRRGVREVRNFR